MLLYVYKFLLKYGILNKEGNITRYEKIVHIRDGKSKLAVAQISIRESPRNLETRILHSPNRWVIRSTTRDLLSVYSRSLLLYSQRSIYSLFLLSKTTPRHTDQLYIYTTHLRTAATSPPSPVTPLSWRHRLPYIPPLRRHHRSYRRRFPLPRGTYSRARSPPTIARRSRTHTRTRVQKLARRAGI